MLEKLLDISREMAETRELDPLLNYAMSIAIELVDAEMGYLILTDEANNLEFRVRLRRDGGEVDQPIQQISQSILAKVVFNREDVILANAIEEDDYQDAESVAALRLRSVMAVPLVSREQSLGAIYVENRSEEDVFTMEDLKVLKFFAGQAAVAIENAMLNDELEARVAARTAELQSALDHLQGNWDEAVEFNRVRTNFLSTIVHDIRSPLSTVLNAQALMLEGAFGEIEGELRQWIETSINTLNHIVRLTDDIFDLTKLEMGKLTVYPEPTALGPFLKQVYEVGTIFPWKRSVSFRKDLADDLPTLDIDPTRIQQVIINLVTNAHKFTESGHVTLYAHRVEGGVAVGVADTGVGISEEELADIFQQYKQAGTKRMRQMGTGLGLAIAQEIAVLHGGQIRVESTPGKGSDFRLVLPL